MQTISSEKTLLTWSRNSNMSNIYLSSINADELFVKPFIEKVFRDVVDVFKAGPTDSFVKTWLKACDVNERALAKELTSRLRTAGILDANAAMRINRVTSKFKGNVGEIMVEMLAENGILDFIKPGSYLTVDPDNEQYIDAEAVRDGLPVGIQIKNYDGHNKLTREVLTKAAAMSDLWLRRDKKVADEDILDFIKTPCQYVISTADAGSELLETDYRNSVVILGPRWLDSRNIQGSIKTGEAPLWRMFRDVADEISRFNG